MGRPRYLIVGIDGATFDVIRPLADAGHLPNLARLMREGVHGPLRSTIHPLTPQAWATFMTGTNPGKHGIFDFGRRAPGAYRIDLATSATRRVPGFWEALGRAGYTGGLLNLPMSYPPEPVRGFNVAGMHTPTLDRGTFPADLHRDLLAAVPDYRIDVMCHWYAETPLFLADVYRMMEARLAAAEYLYRTFRPDVFCPVFVGVDRVQHALWGAFQADVKGHGALAREIVRVYRRMDEITGRLLELVGDGTNVIVMSDHGFGDLTRDVYLNHFLAEAGYLRFDPAKVRAYRPPEPPPTDDPQHSWHHRLFADDGGAIPDDDAAVRAGKVPHRVRSFDTVDWKATVAYAHGLFGNIYLNVHGREPEGVVPRGREYERVRDRIAADLERLRDPEDGGLLCDRVYRREELYSGPAFDEAPDLLVRMRNYSYMTRGACEFLGDSLTSPPVVNHTGNHRMDGILIARGPDFAEGATVDGASLIDLAPTILYGCGVPLPIETDGQVLVSTYKLEFSNAHRVTRAAPGPAARETGEADLSDEEAAQVRERLRALGYLT